MLYFLVLKGSVYIKSHTIFFIVNTIFPLLVGTIFYLVFKPNAYMSQILMKWLPLNTNYSLSSQNALAVLIQNHLCDMLWAYALMMTLCFTAFDANKVRPPIIIECFIFEISIELLQYCGFLSGTFDFADIAAELLSNLMAIAVWKYIVKWEPIHKED